MLGEDKPFLSRETEILLKKRAIKMFTSIMLIERLISKIVSPPGITISF